MKYKVDLNSDLGESFGNYKCGMDEEIIPLISSANVACGFHAADPLVMSKTVKAAREGNTAVGAHPGFPDLVGFGRRNMNVSPAELKAMVMYQVGALKAFCNANHIEMQHVKPHGAMYNMAAKDEKMAAAIAEGIAEVDNHLILLGLSGSYLLTMAKEAGLPCAGEVFADRGYTDDGRLVPRGEAGAMIQDENEAITRTIQMVKEHCVLSANGKLVEVSPDSICVHGDNEKALIFVKLIRRALFQQEIEIAPIHQVIA